MQQLRTLVLLQARGPLRMGDLAAHLGTGMPAATSVVGRLEERGLVGREHDPHDRRVVRCRVTEHGRLEVERFWRLRREHLDRVAAALTDEELNTVARGMELLIRAAEGCRVEVEEKESSNE